MHIVFAVVAILGLAMLAWVVVLVNRSSVQSIEVMSEPEKILEKIAVIDDPVFQTALDIIQEWVDLKRFEHVQYFLCHSLPDDGSIKCSMWWSEKRRCFLALYVAMNKVHYEFVSLYPDGKSLTTSSSSESLILPAPSKEHFRQAFTRSNIDELLQRHKDAQRKLKKRIDITPAIVPAEEVHQKLIEAMQMQAKYVKSLPMWRHSGAYWFFVRRFLLANRVI